MGISAPRASSVVHMLNPSDNEVDTEEVKRCFSERGISPAPSENLTDYSDDLKSFENNNNNNLDPSMELGKAYYYSQLSVMLFEKAVEENAKFPEELDRVHSWFVKDLSDAQKLVCLHELLSLMNPSQHRFLFTSVFFESAQGTEDETVWLDLAMTENQKRMRTDPPPPASHDNVITKLEALDLTMGDSLFSGVRVSKNKLNFERSPSPHVPTKTTKTDSVKNNNSNSNDDDSASESSGTSKFSSFMKSSDADDRNKLTISNERISPTKSAAFAPRSKNNSAASLSGKAPPGFLSPNAQEFRPSEPSCNADVFVTDFVQWLRLLRLHKYTDSLSPLYDADRVSLLKSDEAALEVAGVAALGARKKFLRLFERIQQESDYFKNEKTK